MAEQREMTDQQILADLLKRVEQSARPAPAEEEIQEKPEIIVEDDEILELIFGKLSLYC